MRPEPGIVVVGAGTTAGFAALGLREAGFEGRLTLVGEESEVPYSRPSLSKEYLRGEEGIDQVRLRSAVDLAALGVELRLGRRVVHVDPAGRGVELQDGERLTYSRLLYAAGARARRLSVPGSELEGVLPLRTVADADRIRASLVPGCRVAVVGLGLVGCEVAASLRMLGAEVTGIEAAPAPLASVLGEEVGHVFSAIHSERGVRLLLNDAVTAFEGAHRLERVRTRSGAVVECGLAIVGVGAAPNVEVLRDAGAEVAGGIVVDSLCRTSLDGIWAAGDVAAVPHPVFGRVRVEHWNNAANQGRSAALAMLDRGRPYDYLYSFWSDQYEHSLECLGDVRAWDRVVFRGARPARRFLAFYLQGDRVRAVVGLNRGGNPEDHVRGSELKRCIPIVRDQMPVDPSRLEDEGKPLLSAIVPDSAGTPRRVGISFSDAPE